MVKLSTVYRYYGDLEKKNVDNIYSFIHAHYNAWLDHFAHKRTLRHHRAANPKSSTTFAIIAVVIATLVQPLLATNERVFIIMSNYSLADAA